MSLGTWTFVLSLTFQNAGVGVYGVLITIPLHELIRLVVNDFKCYQCTLYYRGRNKHGPEGTKIGMGPLDSLAEHLLVPALSVG